MIAFFRASVYAIVPSFAAWVVNLSHSLDSQFRPMWTWEVFDLAIGNFIACFFYAVGMDAVHSNARAFGLFAALVLGPAYGVALFLLPNAAMIIAIAGSLISIAAIWITSWFNTSDLFFRGS